MTTQAQRDAFGMAQDLAKYLAQATDAPHEGPAFTGSSNCLANIEADYYRRRKGHWFDADACRFFGTRFNGGFYDVPARGVTLFVTTEKSPSEPRAASVRAYIWKSAEVVTLGSFNSYTTTRARAAVIELARNNANQEAAQ